MKWFRRRPVDPILALTVTPGAALDAAMAEREQLRDGATDEMISELLMRVETLEEGMAQRDAEVNRLIGRVRTLEDAK